MSKRFVVVVLDSLGVGELPDAGDFDDLGADTLGHICEHRAVALPNLAAMGLGNIRPLEGVDPAAKPTGSFGKMAELATGKDTTSGHWELMGLVSSKPFVTYPDGFPEDIITAFCEKAGVDGVLANRPASGTVIIDELGDEHVRTGKPIVYTSADPVFQIAAHEGVIPIERLYEICQAAFEVVSERGVGRVIARPFEGTSGDYQRTHRRRDFSVAPPAESVLDKLVGAGLHVTGVGKIAQIYAHHGITTERKTKNNQDGVDATLELLADHPEGLIFTNLVDFDMLYGHRRNTEGYAAALEAFDQRLPELMAALGEDDVLVLTADHGNDPTYRGTDHTREFVPLLVYGPGLAPGVDLGTRKTFADLGATIAETFGVAWDGLGESFLQQVR